MIDITGLPITIASNILKGDSYCKNCTSAATTKVVGFIKFFTLGLQQSTLYDNIVAVRVCVNEEILVPSY